MTLRSALPGFNSTLVQLKAVTDVQNPLPLPWFQFYLSSIKSGDKRITGAGSFVFQFYLSSIKSANARSRKLGLMMFQFYLSSIKSC